MPPWLTKEGHSVCGGRGGADHRIPSGKNTGARGSATRSHKLPTPSTGVGGTLPYLSVGQQVCRPRKVREACAALAYGVGVLSGRTALRRFQNAQLVLLSIKSSSSESWTTAWGSSRSV